MLMARSSAISRQIRRLSTDTGLPLVTIEEGIRPLCAGSAVADGIDSVRRAIGVGIMVGGRAPVALPPARDPIRDETNRLWDVAIGPGTNLLDPRVDLAMNFIRTLEPFQHNLSAHSAVKAFN
jgi:hypothetical protein